jgi:hypothetical protein
MTENERSQLKGLLPASLHHLLDMAGNCYWMWDRVQGWVLTSFDCPNQNCCHEPTALLSQLLCSPIFQQAHGVELEVQGSFEGLARLKIGVSNLPPPGPEDRAPKESDILVFTAAGKLLAVTDCDCPT